MFISSVIYMNPQKLVQRSAQFGVCNTVQPILETHYGKIDPSNYWMGCINPHVVISGWAGEKTSIIWICLDFIPKLAYHILFLTKK